MGYCVKQYGEIYVVGFLSKRSFIREFFSKKKKKIRNNTNPTCQSSWCVQETHQLEFGLTIDRQQKTHLTVAKAIAVFPFAEFFFQIALD